MHLGIFIYYYLQLVRSPTLHTPPSTRAIPDPAFNWYNTPYIEKPEMSHVPRNESCYQI